MKWVQSSKCDSNHCLQVAWSKSSYSGPNNGACLEAAYKSACDNNACMEVAYQGDVLVRDSKLLDKVTGEYHGPILSFPAAEWDKFIRSNLVRT